MQIYGDSAYELALGPLAGSILRKCAAEPSLSVLRAALIACGQLEQLVEDERTAEAFAPTARRATDHAARAFYAAWSKYNSWAPAAPFSAPQEQRAMQAQLEELAAAEGVRGTLKIPEGFAFYALYPEQYCAAGAAYLARQPRHPRNVQVVGLRSIGTALSAAVAAVLHAAHIDYCRYTVRPHGHPFQREVELPSEHSAPEEALLVDEGPGLSGSSFFAAARALTCAGVPSSQQVIFCAHAEPPGAMASPEISAFWQRTERYAGTDHESAVSPDGSLLASLRGDVARCFGSAIVSWNDISSGRWRAHSYAEPSRWPAACIRFERIKWLALLADGRRVLVKHYGQVMRPAGNDGRVQWTNVAAAQQAASAGGPVLEAHGYVGRLWLEGELLTRADKNAEQLARLTEFLVARPWKKQLESHRPADAYFGCSGRLAAQEWLRQPDGSIRKLPETLQGYDHTAIDSEPLGWDLAAAIVEWELTNSEAEQLLRDFRARTGLCVWARELQPHLRKYAEFHAAKASFCASHSSSAEAQRLHADRERYERQAARAGS